MLYILNAPILPNYGEYRFKKVTVEEAKSLLNGKSWTSAVGHAATAEVLSVLLGVQIPPNRIMIKMEPGDQALVFRLLKRLPEGTVIRSPQELEEIGYELGLLERIK